MNLHSDMDDELIEDAIALNDLISDMAECQISKKKFELTSFTKSGGKPEQVYASQLMIEILREKLLMGDNSFKNLVSSADSLLNALNTHKDNGRYFYSTPASNRAVLLRTFNSNVLSIFSVDAIEELKLQKEELMLQKEELMLQNTQHLEEKRRMQKYIDSLLEKNAAPKCGSSLPAGSNNEQDRFAFVTSPTPSESMILMGTDQTSYQENETPSNFHFHMQSTSKELLSTCLKDVANSYMEFDVLKNHSGKMGHYSTPSRSKRNYTVLPPNQIWLSSTCPEEHLALMHNY